MANWDTIKTQMVPRNTTYTGSLILSNRNIGRKTNRAAHLQQHLTSMLIRFDDSVSLPLLLVVFVRPRRNGLSTFFTILSS